MCMETKFKCPFGISKNGGALQRVGYLTVWLCRGSHSPKFGTSDHISSRPLPRPRSLVSEDLGDH